MSWSEGVAQMGAARDRNPGPIYHQALQDARAPQGSDDALLDDASEGSSHAKVKSSHVQKPSDRGAAIRVTIEGHQIVCVNSGTHNKMTMQLDDSCYAFIKGFLLPLLRKVISGIGKHKKKELAGSSPGKDDETPKQTHRPTIFTFAPELTPNHREKVIWTPKLSAWTVLVKPAPGQELAKSHFTVSQTLSQDEFETEKIRLYWSAVEFWNSEDKSNRHRIPAVASVDGHDA